MSNNRGFKKSCEDCEGCENCRSFSRFRVSSCPLVPTVPQNEPEPPPVFIPVYGSLSTAPGALILAVAGTNVDFSIIGPFSGTTPNIADDSITVNSQGVYTISFSTGIDTDVLEGATNNVTFQLSINGTPDFTKQISFQTVIPSTHEIDTLSRTDQLMLNQGDVIRVFITNANGNITYSNATLVITKVA